MQQRWNVPSASGVLRQSRGVPPGGDVPGSTFSTLRPWINVFHVTSLDQRFPRYVPGSTFSTLRPWVNVFHVTSLDQRFPRYVAGSTFSTLRRWINVFHVTSLDQRSPRYVAGSTSELHAAVVSVPRSADSPPLHVPGMTDE